MHHFVPWLSFLGVRYVCDIQFDFIVCHLLLINSASSKLCRISKSKMKHEQNLKIEPPLI